ncbi:hypothetical protein D9M68_868790 [compost metagenome]
MFKNALSVAIAILFVSGCSSSEVYREQNTANFSADVSQFLNRAQLAVLAYQNGDKTTWERLVCQRPSENTLELIKKFIGTYENVRLVSVRDRWSAANKPLSPQLIEVVFEGTASAYPMPDHKMAVTFVKSRDHCLYLMF